VQPETCTLAQHQSRYIQPRSVPVVGHLCLLNELDKKTASGEGKAITLQAWTALRCPEVSGCQISRQSAHEGDKVVSPTHRPPLPHEIPGTHFCYKLSRPQSHSAAGRII
jgi:hypothetical protein